jgi:hypothetical protein
MTDERVKQFHILCRCVLRDCPDWAAQGYAEHGLVAQSDEEVFVQGLYILSNITHWRHDNAKAVRQALRELVKQCEPTSH